MQDVEFTIERGKLWMLQTRDAKRTAQAAVRIAVDMVQEGLITREQALLRVSPDQVDFFLHPQLERGSVKKATQAGDRIASGLNVSPGAAVGVIAFDADVAERWAKESDRAGHHGSPGDQAGRRARHARGEGAADQPRRAHQPRGTRRPPVRQAGGRRRGGARDRPRVAHHAGRRRGPSPKATGSRSTAPRERSSPASSPRSCRISRTPIC